jgi:hypothetical protein
VWLILWIAWLIWPCRKSPPATVSERTAPRNRRAHQPPAAWTAAPAPVDGIGEQRKGDFRGTVEPLNGGSTFGEPHERSRFISPSRELP